MASQKRQRLEKSKGDALFLEASATADLRLTLLARRWNWN